MNTAIIGSGNVAWHLGKALQQAGHKIVAVYSPTPSHRKELAEELVSAMTLDSLDMRNIDAELFLIAVPDAALASVAAQLQVPAGAIVAHTSGSQPLAALRGIAGAQTSVFYPLQTFSKSKPVDFKNIPILLEATVPETLHPLQLVANSISEQVYEVSSTKRKHLHLAAVFACNFTNHLLGISRELLQQADLPYTLLQPLIQETIAKAMQQHPFDVQTGPAVRQDQNVIEEHLKLLQDQPLYQQVYQLLSQSIQVQHPKE